MRVYIAGPMSGRPNRNAAAFQAAAARWRAAGHVAVMPFDAPGGPPEGWEPALRLGFDLLLGADAMALLPGWEASRGALLELAVAVALQVPVYDAETLAPIAPLVARWHVEQLEPDGAARRGGGAERRLEMNGEASA